MNLKNKIKLVESLLNELADVDLNKKELKRVLVSLTDEEFEQELKFLKQDIKNFS